MQNQRRFALAAAFASLANLSLAQTFGTTTFVSGLTQPVQTRITPTNPRISYVVQKGGRIRVLENNFVQSADLINLSTQVLTAGEGGALGITFDKDFATNRFIYVYMIVPGNISRITRYTVGSNLLSASSPQIIFSAQQPNFSNHKGGTIQTGLDGTLYLALGDGGSGNDPFNLAQDPLSFMGKMIRIDPNGVDAYPADPNNNYAIPADNPFVGQPGVLPEIWATGLRNPYRWWLDPINGHKIIADVGQDRFEEINFEPHGVGGRNYGWRAREGRAATNLGGSTFGTTFQNPFLDYDRTFGQSITGGFIYRGREFKTLQGKYIFADFVSNRLWAAPVKLVNGEAVGITMSDVQVISSPGGLSGVTSIDEGMEGRIMLTQFNGTIRVLTGPEDPRRRR